MDINLKLTLYVEFTLNFGHPMSQPKFNQISMSYDVVCLLGKFVMKTSTLSGQFLISFLERECHFPPHFPLGKLTLDHGKKLTFIFYFNVNCTKPLAGSGSTSTWSMKWSSGDKSNKVILFKKIK